MRTPLRAIEGYSTIIGTDYPDRLDDGARELLRRVRAAAHRMSQLIDDLLTLSQVSRKPLERRQVDLSRLPGPSVNEIRPSVELPSTWPRSCSASFLFLRYMP